MAEVKPVPDGFHSVTPHLVIEGAAKAIAFYKAAFGAQELTRLAAPDGVRIMHAAIKIGDSVVMLGDDFPEFIGRPRHPRALGATPVILHLYVADVDAAIARAVAAGATLKMPATDMFWGDRYGQVADPFGHEWSLATHIKDLTPVEIAQAAQAVFAKGGCGK